MVVAAATAIAVANARARVVGRPVRIAWSASVPITQWPPYAAFVDAMRERGWVEGRHYIVDPASYDGRVERLPAVVADLMARQPDVIIGSGTPTVRPLMQATKTIPIVMFAVGDPVGQGFVDSLGRPGGNVTGLSSVDHGILGKQFELLLEAVPQMRRVGVVLNPDIPPHGLGLREVEAFAQPRGVQVHPVALRTPGEIGAAFDALQRERVEGVHFFVQPIMNTGDRAARVAALALQRRWPAAMSDPAHVRAGMLIAYGWKNEDMVRRLSYFLIRILDGTPPGELPVEQPTRYYLSLNLKTAKALGLTLPQALRLRADEVID